MVEEKEKKTTGAKVLFSSSTVKPKQRLGMCDYDDPDDPWLW